jgi:hypothetical protein
VKGLANLTGGKASANLTEANLVEMNAVAANPVEANLPEFPALVLRGNRSPVVLLKNPYCGNHRDKLNANPFGNGDAIALAGVRSFAKLLQLLIPKPHSRPVKAI